MAPALPRDHPQRIALNDEVHARPPEALVAPLRVAYLALYSEWALREQEWRHVCDLARRYGVPPPPAAANHFAADLGPFRLKWERHTEFTRYTFIVPGIAADPFAAPAMAGAPAEWLAALPGQVMVAAQAALVRAPAAPADAEAIAAAWFGGNALAGAVVAGGAGAAFTDFRIHADGFSRLLIEDRGMTPRQAGRTVQRLLEIDTYRIMALLALPVAQELAPFLTAREGELAAITAELARGEQRSEPALLNRLTALEAEIGRRDADTHYRFSAAAAYYALVRSRIDELREQRIEGLQTFREFTDRRLAPAMGTCRAVFERQDSLSRRVARATQLLSTRVDIAREQQNQAVLESMNRRARLQLRLQQTVEGLSVAAITYYVVGLIGHAAKGTRSLGLPLDPDLVMAGSIPVILILATLGVHRIRRIVTRAAA